MTGPWLRGHALRPQHQHSLQQKCSRRSAPAVLLPAARAMAYAQPAHVLSLKRGGSAQQWGDPRGLRGPCWLIRSSLGKGLAPQAVMQSGELFGAGSPQPPPPPPRPL